MFAVILCVLALGHGAAAAQIVMEATPSDIITGVTTELTVNCSFTFDDSPLLPFGSLMNLLMYRSDTDNQEDNYYAVLSVSPINWESPDYMVEIVDLNGTVSSQWFSLVSGKTTYLAEHWDFPTEAAAGWYRCTASGYSSSGTPMSFSRTAHVTLNGAGVVG